MTRVRKSTEKSTLDIIHGRNRSSPSTRINLRLNDDTGRYFLPGKKSLDVGIARMHNYIIYAVYRFFANRSS